MCTRARGPSAAPRAQVLGDRSLKLKHLNANTLFVASGDGRTLTASLLDTVTGRFLHRQIHAARALARGRNDALRQGLQLVTCM